MKKLLVNLLFLFLTFNTFGALRETTNTINNKSPKRVAISPFMEEETKLPLFTQKIIHDSTHPNTDSESDDDELSFYPKPKEKLDKKQIAIQTQQTSIFIDGLKTSHKNCRQVLPITWFKNLNKCLQRMIFKPEQIETIHTIAKKNNADCLMLFLDEQKKLIISPDITSQS